MVNNPTDTGDRDDGPFQINKLPPLIRPQPTNAEFANKCTWPHCECRNYSEVPVYQLRCGAWVTTPSVCGRRRAGTRWPLWTLPDCAMPDGADPCAGYSQVLTLLEAKDAEIERLKAEVDKWRDRHARCAIAAVTLTHECDRYRTALEKIVHTGFSDSAHKDIARRALAGDEW